MKYAITKRGVSTAICASVVSMMLGLAACEEGSDGASNTESNDQVQSLENELTAATQSRTHACSVSSDCFDAFKACQSAAVAGDTSACKSALEACLPAEAPKPPTCDGTPTPDADAGVTPAPTTPTTPSLPDFGDAGLPDLSGILGDAGLPDITSLLPDGGFPIGGGRPGRGDQGGGRFGGLGGFGGFPSADAGVIAPTTPSTPTVPTVPTLPPIDLCHVPPIDVGVLGSCRDAATSAMASATDPASIQSAHLQCVLDAFAPEITKLCTKASELCAQSGAPAEICQKVTDACTTTSTASP